MAKFSFNGIDGIIADFEELANIDDETKYSILEAGAKVFKEYLQALLRREGRMNPTMPQLINSITIFRKYRGREAFVSVYPDGKRKENRKRGMRMRRKGRPGTNGRYAGTNAEVGYILEYGSPRIPATHWMERGYEESKDAFLAAEQEAWNKHLDDLNL